MQSKASTPDQYIKELPADRKEARRLDHAVGEPTSTKCGQQSSELPQ
jgi:hypothetical protein